MANTLLDLFEKNHQLLEWRDKATLLSRQLVMGFSGSPVNSFEFHSCERTPQVECLMRLRRHRMTLSPDT